MKHFLITRFNLKNEEWKTTASQYEVLTSKWLDARFKIFDRYCFKSVKNQSNQNFTWLVCFDIDTPLAYKDKIESYAKAFKNFKPIYINGFKNLNDDVFYYIQTQLHPEDGHYLTTRLDNDDIIHRDFIKTIQDSYKPQDKTIIDLQMGYQLILNAKSAIEIRTLKLKSNPFVSVVSNHDSKDMVITHSHHYWASYPNQVVIQKQALWIQLIHSDNKLNKRSKVSKRVQKIKYSDFGIEYIESHVSSFSIFIHNLKYLPNRFFHILKASFKS
nr:glycosyltransferase [uncultured Psychroserpens sp.]